MAHHEDYTNDHRECFSFGRNAGGQKNDIRSIEKVDRCGIASAVAIGTVAAVNPPNALLSNDNVFFVGRAKEVAEGGLGLPG
jgi:hypothetical protein